MLVELIPGETPWIRLTAESQQDAHRLGVLEERLGREGYKLWSGEQGTGLVHLAVRPMTEEEERLLVQQRPTLRLSQKHDRLLHYVRRLECACPEPGAAPVCERCQALADVTDWEPGANPREAREGKPSQAGQCRRCADCLSYSHHWLPDPSPHHVWDYACKHCPVKGDECPDCDGEGCDVCDGEGVILLDPEELKKANTTNAE